MSSVHHFASRGSKRALFSLIKDRAKQAFQQKEKDVFTIRNLHYQNKPFRSNRKILDTSTSLKRFFFSFFQQRENVLSWSQSRVPVFVCQQLPSARNKNKIEVFVCCLFFSPVHYMELASSSINRKRKQREGGGRLHTITVHIQVQAYMNIVFPECIYIYIMYRYVCIMYIAIV